MLRSEHRDARNALLHAAAALALGACVYCFIRADTTWLLPAALHAPVLASPRLAALTGSLPVLAHVWAMTWLTAAVAGRESRTAAWAGPVWAAVNVAFEIGQHPSIAPLLEPQSQPFAGGWLLERLGDFFTHGRYDPLDIAVAVATGLVVRRWIVGRRGRAHDPR